MPQGEHMELHRKRHGQKFDHAERKRKREAREVHKRSQFAQKVRGLKSKIYTKKRHAEKATMKKTIAMHQERDNKHKAEDGAKSGAVPAYLLDREQVRSHACYDAEQPCRNYICPCLYVLGTRVFEDRTIQCRWSVLKFSATLSNKSAKRRLASGKFHYQRCKPSCSLLSICSMFSFGSAAALHMPNGCQL